jgi:hypothetical protein
MLPVSRVDQVILTMTVAELIVRRNLLQASILSVAGIPIIRESFFWCMLFPKPSIPLRLFNRHLIHQGLTYSILGLRNSRRTSVRIMYPNLTLSHEVGVQAGDLQVVYPFRNWPSTDILHHHRFAIQGDHVIANL